MKSLVKKAFVRRSFINQVTTCELMTPMVATIGRMVTLSRFLTLFRFDPGALGFSNQFFFDRLQWTNVGLVLWKPAQAKN